MATRAPASRSSPAPRPRAPPYLRSLQASQAHAASAGSGWAPRASRPPPASAWGPPGGACRRKSCPCWEERTQQLRSEGPLQRQPTPFRKHAKPRRDPVTDATWETLSPAPLFAAF